MDVTTKLPAWENYIKHDKKKEISIFQQICHGFTE